MSNRITFHKEINLNDKDAIEYPLDCMSKHLQDFIISSTIKYNLKPAKSFLISSNGHYLFISVEDESGAWHRIDVSLS